MAAVFRDTPLSTLVFRSSPAEGLACLNNLRFDFMGSSVISRPEIDIEEQTYFWSLSSESFVETFASMTPQSLFGAEFLPTFCT